MSLLLTKPFKHSKVLIETVDINMGFKHMFVLHGDMVVPPVELLEHIVGFLNSVGSYSTISCHDETF